MIPQSKMSVIAHKLGDTFGINETIGDFVFKFAALPSGHDIDYALDLRRTTTDEKLKQAIGIVLDNL